MDDFFDGLGNVLGTLIVVAVVVIILAAPVMWLWNWVMPDVFELTEITFWQAFGLSLLSGFLFKGSYNKD